ncbi:thioredoxin domain-containing protein [Achromobacter seleniivolatilans]|uniref:Thioredoxin domain-containing protein n=1 Tax=Achromobacter seleniivolatilans TaxID=3047478 RepID=A0ABY9LZ10_9BURK|nr:thioredoxin domain-containing protein [Achromobacter sp. R39]WMD19705.1 thioredoxin domain-containing protein [Achromobacter sp. R39]
MNRRLLVLSVSVVSIVVFTIFAFLLRPATEPVPQAGQEAGAGAPTAATLVRFHSPVIGRFDAPVTVVEFFDPSCEGCRAFYPYVKQILSKYPSDVRVVMRYVLFHKGSEETVRMLEAARRQGLFEPVLEAILEAQPDWHDDPTVTAAWRAAVGAGLDETRARAEMHDAAISALIKADEADVNAVGIKGTPTFFVNGARLVKLSPQDLSSAIEYAMQTRKE